MHLEKVRTGAIWKKNIYEFVIVLFSQKLAIKLKNSKR